MKVSSRVLSLDAFQYRLEAVAEGGQRGESMGLLLVRLSGDGEPSAATIDELESLLRVVRQNDVIAEVETDTFAVLFTGLSTWKDARIVAERVQYAMSRATGKEVRLGLAVLGKGNIDVTDLWVEARRDLEKTETVEAALAASRSETLRVRSTG